MCIDLCVVLFLVMIGDNRPRPLTSERGAKRLVYISPEGSMLDAIRKLCLHHVHRLPVVERETGNILCTLSHKRLLRYLYMFVR